MKLIKLIISGILCYIGYKTLDGLGIIRVGDQLKIAYLFYFAGLLWRFGDKK